MKSPDEMHAHERIDEITDIIAEGVLRLKHKQIRKRGGFRDVLLDSSSNQSVHATKRNKRKSHE